MPKYKHTIVERNTLRRRLRELARTRLLPALRDTHRNIDVLVRVFPHAYDASFDTLARDMANVTRRLCTLQLPERNGAVPTDPPPGSARA